MNEEIAKSLGLSLSEYLNYIVDINDEKSIEENMTLEEFREYTKRELEYCLARDEARKIDNYFTEINAFASESLFIEHNKLLISSHMEFQKVHIYWEQLANK